MIQVRVISKVSSCRLFSSRPKPNVVANVNLSDVQHHAKLASEWWDPNGPMKGLHALNRLRVPHIRDGLISTGLVKAENINSANVLQGMKILEVGCGAGILTEPLANMKANVTAMDPSEKLLTTAREHFEKVDGICVEYTRETVESHAQGNTEKYDAVVASEVLDHVVDKKSFLKACVETLKPGGPIFISTFNRTLASWLGGIIMAEFVLGVVPKHTHDWNLFISPEEVENILNELNCRTVLVRGIQYKYFEKTCEWSSYTGINYALQAVKNKA